ncbi:next to BRCA1 gene 1 protein [Trichonephila clavipes]|nr:next to BRCA1 gene 1 protein [Trichonephila clavipes]
MRITANIIDEDPFAFTVTSSECIRNERRRKDCIAIEKVESTIKSPKNSNQNQKVKEVTQKFKNLHLSDTLVMYDYSGPFFEVLVFNYVTHYYIPKVLFYPVRCFIIKPRASLLCRRMTYHNKRRHESRFSLSSDCRRQLIWRESGTAYRPENIQEKDRYPTCSIMVWAGIMINGRMRLHVVANGTMTGQRYIDEVLLPHVRLFRGAVGDKFVFMDDNATCHRTLAVQDWLDSEGIQRLVWPARSPDLNPIENVWDALGRQVAGRNYPPTNKNTLIRALTEEWDKLPQQLLDNVVQSMASLAPKPMEKNSMDLSKAGPSNLPPEWLEEYLIKMKSEIKKEVLDELLQVSQGELPPLNPGATAKGDENQSDFQGEVVHVGIYCDNCDQLIHGIRYKCGNCSDFDLCQECESLPNIHNKNHIFLKIRYPIALKMYLRQRGQEVLTSPNPVKTYMGSRSRQAKKLYEAKFVHDDTVPDSTVLPPSIQFLKRWRVINTGLRVWTHATKLHLIQGSPGFIPSTDHVDVPHLKPGEEGVISVTFTTPPYPGVYRSHWNFCHKSRPFGDIVWCHIIVKSLEDIQKEKSEVENIQNEETMSEIVVSSEMEKGEMTEQIKYCHFILKELFEKHKIDAWPFYQLNLKNYSEKITTPMDIYTVQIKLKKSLYTTPDEFYADMQLIWMNCYEHHREYQSKIAAKKFQEIFENLYFKMPNEPTSVTEISAPTIKVETGAQSSDSAVLPSSNCDEDKKRELKSVENKQDKVACIAEVLTAVKKEHDRGNLVPRKLVVSSHTATPNNTPFDLTPPKSPDHHATVKEMHNVTEDHSSQYIKDSDDECSIVSLGSSESDTEFVVIPMPKCFNLSESFVSQHVPQWLQNSTHDSDSGHLHKTMHKMMQLGKQEVGIILGENVQSNSSTQKTPPTSETVSQETGVPELSVISCDQSLLEIVENQNTRKTSISIVTDGSSSEVSIIESGDNSPVVENAAQTIESVNLKLISEGITNEIAHDLDTVVNAVQQEVIEVEDQNGDIPSNTTFPKFPVEFVSSTYDPTPAPALVSKDERTVQVLPEGLVTGALSAAASVYNSAWAVLSTIQQQKNATEGLSQELPTTVNAAPPLIPMVQLIEMGFCNRQQNEELLRKHSGDVTLVVAELVNQNDNDWYASRHIPSPPPFD